MTMKTWIMWFALVGVATAIILTVLAPPERAETLNAKTIVGGAGDIADSSGRAESTAALVKSVLNPNASAMAYTLGDMAYPNGTSSNFNNKYNPTWGDFKVRTLPCLGNHEYFDGSGTAADAKAYWAFQNDSYDLYPPYYSIALNPDWQYICLDSSKTETPEATGAPSCDTQRTFLINQLQSAKSAGKNVIAAFHHSRWSNSLNHPSSEGDGCPRLFWEAMVANDGDLVLAAHSHLYERFSKRNASGSKVGDKLNGVTQVTCGTGGGSLDSIRATKSPTPDRINNQVWGVCKVDLAADSYTLSFLETPASPDFSDTVTERVNP